MAVKQKRCSKRPPTSGVRHLPRLEIVADEETLTPFGGSAVVGELARRLGLIPALDRAIAEAPRSGGLKPVKERQRGASPGAVLVALADPLVLGGEAVQGLERLRADGAGAELAAVEEIPAASTAAQLARRFRRTRLRAAEEAFARVANPLGRQLGPDPARPVTLDFASTQVEVYGRRKPGARVDDKGALAYQPLVCSWAERGRTLASELLSGSASTKGEEPRQLLARALAYLPEGHGEVRARLDSGFYRLDLLRDCRRRGVRFSVSVPRTSAMGKALERVGEEEWLPAEQLREAEVAGTT